MAPKEAYLMDADTDETVFLRRLPLGTMESGTLLQRYLEEMSHIVGDRSRLDLNFRVLVERLFGAAAEARVERALKSRRT